MLSQVQCGRLDEDPGAERFLPTKRHACTTTGRFSHPFLSRQMAALPDNALEASTSLVPDPSSPHTPLSRDNPPLGLYHAWACVSKSLLFVLVFHILFKRKDLNHGKKVYPFNSYLISCLLWTQTFWAGLFHLGCIKYYSLPVNPTVLFSAFGLLLSFLVNGNFFSDIICASSLGKTSFSNVLTTDWSGFLWLPTPCKMYLSHEEAVN